jgi:sugar lactone lactonase YvrE
MPVRALLLLSVLCACGGRQPPPSTSAGTIAPTLELVATSPRMWSGVAAWGGRIFVSFPHSPAGTPIKVGELARGEIVPWPDSAWNAWTPGAPVEDRHFVAVQSVHADTAGSLWVVDTGNPALRGMVARGPRLFQFDASSRALVRAYAFGPDAVSPDSYLSDVRVDRHAGTAYLTDSNAGGLIVLDLTSGEARKVLADHPSTLAAAEHLDIQGRRFERTIHADGIALSPDRAWLYYAVVTGHTLWRVPTAALRDPGAAVGAQVERVRSIVATDGMRFAPDGSLYLGGVENASVYVLRPDGRHEQLLQDDRLSWPGALALDERGNLLVLTMHLHLPPEESRGHELWRIRR